MNSYTVELWPGQAATTPPPLPVQADHFMIDGPFVLFIDPDGNAVAAVPVAANPLITLTSA